MMKQNNKTKDQLRLEYQIAIISMVKKIENIDFLRRIYTFVKVKYNKK